ncbi:hypothetical protein N9933_02300 [bacterium]|nr:hypothetical protein [bacterium]
MTGEEKRRQLKEQFKKDLRKRKEFLEKTNQLRQMRNINKSVGDMIEGIKDDSDEWINKLNEGTALSEAKLDIALDQASTEELQLENLAQEIEMEKMNAQLMVEQMKRELGLSTVEVEVEEETETSEKTTAQVAEPKEPKNEKGSQSKTMGDF